MNQFEQYSFEAYQGTSISLVLVLKDNAGLPIDLTGQSVYAHMRTDYNAPLALDLDPQITNALQGEVTITKIVPADLKSMPYRWDLLLEDSADVVRKIVQGVITVLPTVTQIPPSP